MLPQGFAVQTSGSDAYYLDIIATNETICCYKDELLNLCLCDQKPVEGIAMVIGQIGHLTCVLMCDWQWVDAVTHQSWGNE